MSVSTPSKTVTINDVARAVGMSRTTVSAALSGNGRLSDETRELVQREAEKLGYQADFFAQGLRKKQNDLIGFFSPDLDLGISTLKMHAIWGLLDARGYTVPVLSYGNRVGGKFVEQEKLLAELRRQKPRAMICNTSNLQSDSAQNELRRYLEEGGLAVCYDWALEIETDAVVFDREHNTYTATRHLLERGHRKIGLGIPFRSTASNPRLEGFSRALREWGLEARTDWILEGAETFHFELDGAALAQNFLALRERPTAMAILNDHVASNFAVCLGRAGIRVPHDLSLVSHDNFPIAEVGPFQLSTVSHPISQIAGAVVEMLDSRLTGRYDGPPRREIIRGELFERGSVLAAQ